MKNQIFDLIRIILPMLPDNAKTLVPSMLLTGLVWQLSFITHKFIELSEKNICYDNFYIYFSYH